MGMQVEDKINLTEEQERMWKKLSTPYEPPNLGNYGAYGYSSYAPPVSFKTRYGYTVTANTTPIAGIVVGA